MYHYKKIVPKIPYKQKIKNTIEYLDNDRKNLFKKSLDKHKFNLEVYIPDSLSLNKIEYKKKDYLLNKLIKFTKNYNLGKENIEKIQKDNYKFTKQYELVKSQNEEVQNTYLNEIQEIYKIKGYDSKAISYKKKENIFSPSLLLIEDKEKYPLTCRVEKIKDIKKDISYLNKFEKALKENRGKSKEEIEEEMKKRNKTFEKNTEKKNSVLFIDDYSNAMDNVRQKIMEELKMKNMSFQQLRKINLDLINNIKETKASINNINDDYINKKKYVDDEIFLSSKGMIRSAKKKNLNENNNEKEDNNDNNILIYDYDNMENEKNKEIKEDEIKITFQRKRDSELEKKNKENFNKERVKKLTRIYSNIIRTNFKEEQKDIKNYINIYTDRKPINLDNKYGSNLHGFLSDFQNYISKTKIPVIANNVKDDMFIINKMKENSDSSIDNNINIGKKIKIEHLTDLDNKIKELGYKYTESLLKNKY